MPHPARAGFRCAQRDLPDRGPFLLQNDKRQLETAMVVESQIQMKQKGLSKRSMGDESLVASEVKSFPPTHVTQKPLQESRARCYKQSSIGVEV